MPDAVKSYALFSFLAEVAVGKNYNVLTIQWSIVNEVCQKNTRKQHIILLTNIRLEWPTSRSYGCLTILEEYVIYVNKTQKNFSEKQKGFRDGLSYSTPQKSEETRGNAITQPWSSLNPFCFLEKIFCFLFVRLLRAHEMRSQLEVTEMLEYKVNLTV